MLARNKMDVCYLCSSFMIFSCFYFIEFSCGASHDISHFLVSNLGQAKPLSHAIHIPVNIGKGDCTQILGPVEDSRWIGEV